MREVFSQHQMGSSSLYSLFSVIHSSIKYCGRQINDHHSTIAECWFLSQCPLHDPMVGITSVRPIEKIPNESLDSLEEFVFCVFLRPCVRHQDRSRWCPWCSWCWCSNGHWWWWWHNHITTHDLLLLLLLRICWWSKGCCPLMPPTTLTVSRKIASATGLILVTFCHRSLIEYLDIRRHWLVILNGWSLREGFKYYKSRNRDINFIRRITWICINELEFIHRLYYCP